MTRLARLAPIGRLVLLTGALALAACGQNPTAPDAAHRTPRNAPPTTAKPDYINPNV